MRAIIFTAFITLSSFVVTGGSHINFHYGDIRSALELAQLEEKLVFVDVYAQWCTSCKLMEESTFRAQPVVRVVNDHYVAVKINIESLEGELFAAQEGITTLPALLVLDAQGQKLAQVNEALQAEGMLQMLKKYLD